MQWTIFQVPQHSLRQRSPHRSS